MLPDPSGIVGMIELVRHAVGAALRTHLGDRIQRINTLIFNRVVAAGYGSFRQIWAGVARRAGGDQRHRRGSPVAAGERFVSLDIGAGPAAR